MVKLTNYNAGKKGLMNHNFWSTGNLLPFLFLPLTPESIVQTSKIGLSPHPDLGEGNLWLDTGNL